MIRLRIAEERDAEALLSIYSYYVDNTAITFEWSVPTVQEFGDRIRSTKTFFPYLVAYDDETSEAVGYAYASHFNHRKAYEWCAEVSIYVDKDHRKNGVGKLLYAKLEEILQLQGIIRLYACVAYSDIPLKELDSNSLEFHKRMGYRLVGTFQSCGYKFGRWFDMVWMEKTISECRNNIESVVPFPELNKKI